MLSLLDENVSILHLSHVRDAYMTAALTRKYRTINTTLDS